MDAPPAIDFSGHMADAEITITNNGFSTELWIPEFGWDSIEEEASEAPHPPQLLAALQCFIAFYARPMNRVWVHLAAEMQAGKTGVVTTLIRLILKNSGKLGIRPTRIFVLTGMNDNAWKKQTRDRLPSGVRSNVHHNGGLTKFAKTITGLCAKEELRNVLFVIDESHLASSTDNRPNKLIYETVARLCPQEKWQENRICFLTISATDPSKVLVMRGEETAQVVRLQTTPFYQSVESLERAKRIRWLETFKDLHHESAITELKRCITEEFKDIPSYHIIRARHGKHEDVMRKLSIAFPKCQVLKFDSEERIVRRSTATEETSSCLSEIEDINDILREPPEQHTFIVLKNMFYASKTLHDEYVGVLWDRLSAKDDTNLQSLLGRACGYGKSKRTVIYTSRQTVENYLRFWKDLCSNPRFPPSISGIPVSKIVKRMPLLKARGSVLSASSSAAAPIIETSTNPVEAKAHTKESSRKQANEDDFEHTYEEFNSLEDAKVKHKRLHIPNIVDGFYLTSTTGSAEKQPYTAILAICTGKKTANLPSSKLNPGTSTRRLYVGYKDLNDPKSAVFVVRILKRIS